MVIQYQQHDIDLIIITVVVHGLKKVNGIAQIIEICGEDCEMRKIRIDFCDWIRRILK
jgi:hypothetical protein